MALSENVFPLVGNGLLRFITPVLDAGRSTRVGVTTQVIAGQRPSSGPVTPLPFEYAVLMEASNRVADDEFPARHPAN